MDDRTFAKPMHPMSPRPRPSSSASSSSGRHPPSPDAEPRLRAPLIHPPSHSPRPLYDPDQELRLPATGVSLAPYSPVAVISPIGYYHSRYFGLPALTAERFVNSLEPAPHVLPLWNLYPVPASPESPRQHTSVIRHTDKAKTPSNIIQKAPQLYPPSPSVGLSPYSPGTGPFSPGPGGAPCCPGAKSRQPDGPMEDGPSHRKRRRSTKRRTSDAGASASSSQPGSMIGDPGRSTSHAVYAKYNRERRKKYIGDMEVYRSNMRRTVAESRARMERVEDEKRVLNAEIGQLREKLMSNDQLMSVLKNLSRSVTEVSE